MMNYEAKGTIVEIGAEQQITEKFKKREFVIEDTTKPEWPELIKFQVTQDKCDLLTPLKLMQFVTVSFNLRGRKYEKDGKTNYFTNLEAWRITTDGTTNTPKEQAPNTSQPSADGLPF
jgi:hypothetical protein